MQLKIVVNSEFHASRILFDVIFSLAFKDFVCPEYVAEMTVVPYFYYIVFFGKFLRIAFFFGGFFSGTEEVSST